MPYLPFVSADRQTVLGHYGCVQLSGAIAATPTALDVHASVRWAPGGNANSYFVLLRLRLGWQCISAITTAVRMSYQASIVRALTVDYVTGSTAASMASSGKMRSSMGTSLLGALGPRVTTTGAMTGSTGTVDAFPFATTTWPSILATNSTGTAVALPAGMAGAMQDVYVRGPDGSHPPVLANNEGIQVALTHTGWATGTVSLLTEWTWAEVLAF